MANIKINHLIESQLNPLSNGELKVVNGGVSGENGAASLQSPLPYWCSWPDQGGWPWSAFCSSWWIF